MSRNGGHRTTDRVPRARYRRAALIAGVGLVLATVAVFVKQNPFSRGFQVKAVFSSAAQLTIGSQVRIAGVQVGHVSGIASGPHHTALVTMSIGSGGLPIHVDATATVKPRLILEGNAYIDLQPGSPAAPAIHSGATLPEGQTAVSVQLDQVLDVLNMPVRDALQSSVAQLARGLGGAPTGSIAPGFESLRAAVRQLDGALGPVGQVAQAVGGTSSGDAAKAVDSTGAVTGQLAQDPRALADVVTNYNHVFATLASEYQPLAASISGFDQVMRVAPTPLRDVDVALPTLTSFANKLRPTLRAAPATFTDATRLLEQIGLLVAPGELPALLDKLSPVLVELPGLEPRLATMFGYTSPVTDCISTHVVPTLNMHIQDGVNTTGDPVYLDLMHLFTGLTSFSSAVDGNGGTVRLGITTGDRIVDTVFPGLGQIVGRLPNVDGVRPVWLGYATNPPVRPDQPCASQPLPQLNTQAVSGPLPQWAR